MTVNEFQQLIEAIYFTKDNERGLAGTFMWFTEEVGELSRALTRGTSEELQGEFADCAAWLATLASLAGVDLEAAVTAKYGQGCPKCRQIPCACDKP